LAKDKDKEKSAKGPAAAEKPEKKKETPMEFIASMAVVLVVGLFIITFNLQAFEIPSSSMEDTLLIGDHVFVDRVTPAPKTSWFPVIPYRNLKHGDIMVFLSPSEPGLFVVKRVIGIPGDHIHLRDGVVYRNGQALNEPYVIRSVGNYDPYRDNFPDVTPLDASNVTQEWRLTMGGHIENGDIVVPPDSYFGMGDNRDVSFDSRYWGFVPGENVVGSPTFIYWSFEEPADQYKKTAMSDRIAFVWTIMSHFFTETRWHRMFHLVK
jgi:signal peptidase I